MKQYLGRLNVDRLGDKSAYKEIDDSDIIFPETTNEWGEILGTVCNNYKGEEFIFKLVDGQLCLVSSIDEIYK